LVGTLAPPLNLFEEALDWFAPRQTTQLAVQLIQDGDLPRLVQRMGALEELISDETPFFTLPEFANHAREFSRFLKSHRDYLVKTGLPPRFFRPCEWLHIHLGRLYDTRQTGSVYSFDELFGPSPDVDEEPPYRWVKTPRASADTYSDYEEADLLWGMERAEVDRIERDRNGVFDAKLQIVEYLGRLTFESDPQERWQLCLSVLTGTFNADEIDFWLRMDRFYFDGIPRLGSNEACSPKQAPGGLTNLLEVMGRYEAEIRHRTFTDAEPALNELVTNLRKEDAGHVLAPHLRYFHVLGHADRNTIDTALDDFLDRIQTETGFWEDYRFRVRTALQKEFRIAVPVYLFPRHVELLGPHLQREAKLAGDSIDQGRLLILPTPSQRVFHKQRKSWTIIFNGTVAGMPHSVGLSHIAELLRRRGKPMYARDLRDAQLQRSIPPSSALRRSDVNVDPSSASKKQTLVHVPGRKEDGDGDDGSGGGGGDQVALISSDAGDVLDNKAKAQYVAARSQLKKELAVAESAGDLEKVEKSRQEIDFITQELNKAFTPSRAPRKMQSEEKKANDAVRVAINRALVDLKDAHPPLWRHLEQSLTVGPFVFLYSPEPPIDWEF
jgi:hypothetical protein